MFKHLLTPLDGSTTAQGTLPHLVALARLYQARVTLVRVLECPDTIIIGGGPAGAAATVYAARKKLKALLIYILNIKKYSPCAEKEE